MAPSTYLLTTKLNHPRVRASLVARPRLTARLDAGLGRALTLISAPAGSGKTTLVTEWLAALGAPAAGQPPVIYAWLSLDEDDNDPLRFLTGLAAALGQLGAPADGSAPALLQAARPRDVSARTILAALLNDFQARPGPAAPAVLVLDDYHLITAGTVHTAVGYLLERRPSALHLVITSRTEPPIPLARLRASDQLTEIRAPDLHFTVDEAADFLNRAMGLSLTVGQVAALEARTEGWIAALQLAALALQTTSPAAGMAWRDAFIDSFTGSHRYVLDYLVEEVLSRQPEAVQTFLRRTSLLERLSGPLCEAVTGQPGGAERLIELERANLFVVPMDGERQWYRYHHLFAEALRAQLARDPAADLPALHARASQWFEQNAMPAEAIQHALAAGDFERAADLIDPAADQIIRRGELETIRQWVSALPEAIIRARPSLSLWLAWTLIPLGRLDEVQAYADRAEAGLRQQRAAHTSLSGADPAWLTHNDILLGQVLLVRCSLAQHRHDLEAAVARAHEALETLPPAALTLRSLAQLDLAFIHQHRGQPEAAATRLRDGLAEMQHAYHPFIHLQLLTRLVEISLVQLRLPEAADLCREAIALAERQQVTALVGEAWLYLSEVMREWNQLDEAEAHLARCVNVSEHGGDEFTLRRAYSVWVRVKQARGDWAAATAMQVRGSRNPAWLAGLWLAQGNLEAARQVFDRRGRRGGPAWTAQEDLIRARVRLAQGRAQAALAVLKRWRAPLEAAGRHDLAAELALVEALAYQAEAQWPQALRALSRALALAEPAGCVRLFLDEGPPMVTLLERYAATQSPRPYVQGLLAAFPGREAATPKSLNGHASNGQAEPLLEPLSAREAEIVRLLAAGFSNPEIAARLSLSVNTVRWYVKQLYRKLDVHNRTQAALRARALNLA